MPDPIRGLVQERGHPFVLEIVDTLVLMLQGAGRSLEGLREPKDEEGLMKLVGRDQIPEPDKVGDWLRRMGDPKSGQLGLAGLDRVREKINERVLKKDGIKEYILDADAFSISGVGCKHVT